MERQELKNNACNYFNEVLLRICRNKHKLGENKMELNKKATLRLLRAYRNSDMPMSEAIERISELLRNRGLCASFIMRQLDWHVVYALTGISLRKFWYQAK